MFVYVWKSKNKDKFNIQFQIILKQVALVAGVERGRR